LADVQFSEGADLAEAPETGTITLVALGALALWRRRCYKIPLNSR